MLRPAHPTDAAAIAALHTLSWQLNYRAAMPDRYLDEEAPAERLAFWTDRLAKSPATTETTLAINADGDLIGFCCLEPDAHPADGYYLNNLHVAATTQGTGVGKRLMRAAAARLLTSRPDGDIFLWVLTSNARAIRFYDYLGATRGRSETLTLVGNSVPAIMMRWRLSEMAAW
jgi:hypothetical protein